MKKLTKRESHQDQKTKNFNSKLWIRVLCIVLSVATVAVVCLGIALFAANDKISALQTDLSGLGAKHQALSAENLAAWEEINSLKNSLELTDAELDGLAEKYEQVSEALTQLKTEKESLEKRLDTLEKANQSAQDEIGQLKNDVESANKEIADLKEQLRESGNKIRIYIDQGHNPAPYHNSGAEGNGLYEQDVTFQIGCLLAELLSADKRFEIKLSRPNKSVVLGTDNKSSVMARVEGAAEFDADYLISLHINSFTQDTANGIEVYAAEESSESYAFGEALLAGMIGSTSLKDRGMKLNPDLDILEYSSMPAVLLEMGFISNSTDAALLAEHPELFAEGIYNGILSYFGFLPSTPDVN